MLGCISKFDSNENVLLLYLGKRKFPPTPSLHLSSQQRKERTRSQGLNVGSWCLSGLFTFFFFYRATAFGILNGLCKFGAILGNTIFASFVGITKVVPILLAATSLVGGGLIALRLPETREQVLMWATRQERKCQKNLVRELSVLPHFLSATVRRTLDSTGRNVDFVTPSLGPISAVKMFVTQVTDLGCPEPPWQS